MGKTKFRSLSHGRSVRATIKAINIRVSVQGDHSGRTKPPIDFKTNIPLWPDQARLVQAKAELSF